MRSLASRLLCALAFLPLGACGTLESLDPTGWMGGDEAPTSAVVAAEPLPAAAPAPVPRLRLVPAEPEGGPAQGCTRPGLTVARLGDALRVTGSLETAGRNAEIVGIAAQGLTGLVVSMRLAQESSPNAAVPVDLTIDLPVMELRTVSFFLDDPENGGDVVCRL